MEKLSTELNEIGFKIYRLIQHLIESKEELVIILGIIVLWLFYC